MADLIDQNCSEEQSLPPIKLEPGIYDFNPQIRDYIANGTPLSDDILNVLDTFASYFSLDEYIHQNGREVVLKEIDASMKKFDIEKAKIAVQEGVKKAQVISNEEEIAPFPVVFLWSPTSKSGTALHGQGCAINISKLRDAEDQSNPEEIIKRTVAHESVHLFLKQLGLRTPDDRDSLQDQICDFLWEEGLAKNIEDSSSRYQRAIEQDAKFWLEIINSWLQTDDPQTKQNLLKRCLEPGYIHWGSGKIEDINNMNLGRVSLDRLFFEGITRKTGIGYYIGSYLWNKQKESGISLSNLVKQRGDMMKVWIKQ